jgi:hypothetical protein
MEDPSPGPIVLLGVIAVVLFLIWGEGRQAESGPRSQWDFPTSGIFPLKKIEGFRKVVVITARGPRWTA